MKNFPVVLLILFFLSGCVDDRGCWEFNESEEECDERIGMGGYIPPDNSQDHPQIDMDESGNTVAVWRINTDVKSNTAASVYSSSNGWGTVELIGTIDGGYNSYAKISMDNNGTAITIWRHQGQLLVNRYTPGTGWATANVIDTAERCCIDYFNIVMDSNGNAIASWSKGYSSIRTVRYESDVGWSAVESIVNNITPITRASVTVNSSGNAVLVWGQGDKDSNLYTIWSSRYILGSGWGIAERIENNIKYPKHSKIAMNAEGK